MKKTLQTIGSTLLLIGATYNANATHANSASLEVDRINDSTYTVTLKLYEDCQGIQTPNNQTIFYKKGSGNLLGFQMSRTSSRDITPVNTLPGGGLNSNCNPSATNATLGVRESIYHDTLTINNLTTGDSLLFKYFLCCRSTNITNINSPGTQSLYVENTIIHNNNTTNQNPSYHIPPVFFAGYGNPFIAAMGAYDQDGDSLVYRLATPQNGSISSTQSCTFVSPATVSNPMNATSSFYFDNAMGNIFFVATGAQACVFDIITDEYRNGQLIGSYRRAAEIIIFNSAQAGCSPKDSSGVLISTNNVLQTEFVANDIADTLDLRLDLSTISSVYPGSSITTSHSNGKSKLLVDIATPAQSNLSPLKSAVLVIEKNGYLQNSFALTLRKNIVSKTHNFNNDAQNISIYPTPMVSNTRFELNETAKKLEVRLFNQLGQHVLSAVNNNSEYVELNKQQLTEGVYFYQLFKNEKMLKTGQLHVK